MAVYERTQVSTLLSRLNEKPQRLTIVTGPRQIGKTTLVQQALRKLDRPSHYVSVDEPDSAVFRPIPDLGDWPPPEFVEQPGVPTDGSRDTRWLVRIWEQARVASERSGQGFVLVIDEIQILPNWSETVKGLWDSDRWHDRPLHVILLCSFPFLKQQGMSESLAGRFETIRLMHWSFAEMSVAFGFDLQRYVYFGGYPGSAPLIPEQSRWRAYLTEELVEPNIERDILAMQRSGQTRAIEAAVRARGRVFRADSFIQQDAWPASGRRQHDDLGALHGAPVERWPDCGIVQVCCRCLSTKVLQSQTQRAQQRAHGC